jgi:hypothetical protein
LGEIKYLSQWTIENMFSKHDCKIVLIADPKMLRFVSDNQSAKKNYEGV